MRYRMGDLVELVTETNSDLKYGLDDIIGVTLEKQMIPTIANLTQTNLDDFIIVHPKDFVYNPRTHGKKIGLGFNTTDRCFISTWNNNTFRVKPNMLDTIIPEYLYMHFLRERWDKEACFNAWGSSTVVLLWSSFCDMKINVPPISEQRKIVHDYQVITDRIELLKKINENLEEQIQAVYYSFCSDDVMKPSTVGSVALNITDGVHNTVIDDPNGEYLLLSCKNIKGGHLSIGKDERTIDEDTFFQLRKRSKLEKGDILLSSVGTVGEMVLLNENPSYYEFQRSVAMIKPNCDLISPEYLFATLKAKKKDLIQAAHGAVQQCIFISDIAAFPITIADAAVIKDFTNIVRPMFRFINDYEKELTALFKMQTAILQRLTKGA